MIDNQKKVLITGVNGQDGQYLAEFLVNRNYQVFGTDLHEVGLKNLKGRYYPGSISDLEYLADLIQKIKPDYIYNLASVSQVSASFKIPEETFLVNLLPVIRMLELIRTEYRDTRLLQATSSEIFGGKSNPPYNENSAHEPMSPYAVSKEAAYHMVKLYRRAYNIFACNAILFNHTSPKHAPNYVIAKIVNGLVAIKLGQSSKIRLGDLSIERDWGFAGDYVKAMSSIIEHEKADDFVIGSGKPRSLRAIVDYILNKLDLRYNDAVEIDQNLLRLNDPKNIYSDPSKIMKILGWRAEKPFEEVLDMMIEEELRKQRSKNG